VHNAYRLALDGPSMRKSEAPEVVDAQKKGLPMKEQTGGTAAPEAKAAKAGREKDQRRP